MIKLFIRFLKENNIYKIFQDNLMKEERKNIIQFCIDNELFYKSYISHAFTWINTEQGNDFWHPLHNKWLDEIIICENS